MGILFDSGPQLFCRQRETGSQAVHSAGNIHTDQYAADIKDDGAKLGARHGLLSLNRWCRCGAPNAQQTDDHGNNGKQNHHRNHVVDALGDVGD